MPRVSEAGQHIAVCSEDLAKQTEGKRRWVERGGGWRESIVGSNRGEEEASRRISPSEAESESAWRGESQTERREGYP